MKQVAKFLLSLVLFVLALHAIGLSWSLVAIVTYSVYLHELGHWAALRAYGFKSSIYFLPLLGAVTTTSENEKKLTDTQNLVVTAAGPLINVFLFFIVLAYGSQEAADLNARLLFFNMLPIFGIFDGGRITKLLFKNVDLRQRQNLVSALVYPVLLIFVLGFFAHGEFIVWVMSAGLLLYMAQDLRKSAEKLEVLVPTVSNATVRLHSVFQWLVIVGFGFYLFVVRG